MDFLERSTDITLLGVYDIRHAARTWHTEKRNLAVLSFRHEGQGVFYQGQKRYPTKAGDMIYIPANIAYRQDSYGEAVTAIHFRATPSEDTQIELFPMADCGADFAAIRRAAGAGTVAGRYRAFSLFCDLLSRLSVQRETAGDTRLRSATEYMRKNLAVSSLSVSEIAREAGVSEVYLRRLCHRAYGKTPLQMLHDLRIERAKDLLTAGYDTMDIIAAQCGYADGKYFSAAFRHAVGMPAKEWRKRTVSHTFATACSGCVKEREPLAACVNENSDKECDRRCFKFAD